MNQDRKTNSPSCTSPKSDAFRILCSPQRPTSSPPNSEASARQYGRTTIPPVEQGIAELLNSTGPARRPYSMPQYLSGTFSVQISETELGGDTDSVDSRQRPNFSRSSSWRPSFFRIGPLIGLAVCRSPFAVGLDIVISDHCIQ